MSGKHHNKHNKSSHKKNKPAKSLKKALKAVQAISSSSGHGTHRPKLGRVKGHGDYLGDVLGKVGHHLGSKVGNFLQGGFRRLTGFGDYRSHGPSSNSLYSHAKRNADGPSEASFSMGSCAVKFGGKAPRVQHREYIGPVISQGPAFHTKVYHIQPGLSGVDVAFPWGSAVAECFQQYILHGAIFEYVSTSSEYAATSALGSVMMSTVYDAQAKPLSSVMAVDNNEYTTLAKPSVSFYHPIECASRDNPTTIRWIRRQSAITTGTDERLDDVGIFQISTNGISAEPGTQLGELWVTYDMEFLKSELPDVHEGTSAHFDYTVSGPNGLAPSTDLKPHQFNSLPAWLSVGRSAGVVKVNMPAGYHGTYTVTLAATAKTGTFVGTAAAPVYGTDLQPINLYPSPTSTEGTAMTWGTTTTTICMTLTFSTTAETPANNYVELSGSFSSFPPTGWNVTVNVTAVDNDLTDTLSRLRNRAARGCVQSITELVRRERIESMRGQGASEGGWEDDDEKEVTKVAEALDDVEKSVYLPRGAYAELLSRVR